MVSAEPQQPLARASKVGVVVVEMMAEARPCSASRICRGK